MRRGGEALRQKDASANHRGKWAGQGLNPEDLQQVVEPLHFRIRNLRKHHNFEKNRKYGRSTEKYDFSNQQKYTKSTHQTWDQKKSTKQIRTKYNMEGFAIESLPRNCFCVLVLYFSPSNSSRETGPTGVPPSPQKKEKKKN